MGLDQSDGWQDNDPLPLGDEVSMGVISRPESENNRTNFTQGNLLKGIDKKKLLEDRYLEDCILCLHMFSCH